jgi:acyl-CoA dehydrogenase
VLAEYGAERWLREAMILAIWEGTSHRQILDGLEVMERKRAHKTLFRRLEEIAPSRELQDLESETEQHLKLPLAEREALSEPLFRKLAVFTAETLARK